MKLVGRVVGADGAPLEKASAEVVAQRDGSLSVVAQGSVQAGDLAVDLPGDFGMAWGLWINGAPVLAVVTTATVEVLEVGVVRMLAQPLAMTAFHAPDGRVHGLPEGLRAAGSTSGDNIALEPTRMTFGDMFGSTARQLGSVSADPSSGLTLTGASITLRGVPTASADAVGLEFPSLSAIGSGTPLSELSFSLRPRPVSGGILPTGPVAPALTGYTRELALRKVAAAGLVAEVSHEIVSTESRVGRVTRQVPAAGAVVTPGQVVRLFIGKNDEP